MREAGKIAVLVGARLLLGAGHEDASAEHDAEEGGVDGDNAARPLEKGRAEVFIAGLQVTVDNGFIDVSHGRFVVVVRITHDVATAVRIGTLAA